MSTSSRSPIPREDSVTRVLALGAVTMMLAGGLVSSGPVRAVPPESAAAVTVVARSSYGAAHPSYDVGRTVTIKPAPTTREATGRPVHVDIPALEVSADVAPIVAAGTELVPPSDPRLLGWWADGAEPGAVEGTAILTGHTVSTGGGALDLLHRLRPGDGITVRTADGVVSYVATRVVTYSKPALAKASDRLFSQDVAGRLVLVTCTDYNGVEYLSNTVVVASPTGSPVG